MVKGAEGTKIQGYIKQIIKNKLSQNGTKEVSESDINEVFNNFKFKYNADSFDWDKAAKAANQVKSDSKSGSVFGSLTKSGSKNSDEDSLMQLFAAVMSNDDVFNQVDSGAEDKDGKVSGKGDGKISAEEMKAYFEALAEADKKAESDKITLSDFGAFFAKKNSKNGNKFDFEKTANDSAKNASNTTAAAASGGGAVGGGGAAGGGGGSYGGDYPAGSSYGGEYADSAVDDTTLFGEQAQDMEPVIFPEKFDPDTLDAYGKENYITGSIKNLESLSNLDSSEITSDVREEGNPISGMDNISTDDRQRLQEAASDKETAKTGMDEAKAQVEETEKTESFEAIEKLQEITESVTKAQEDVNDFTNLIETYTTEIDTLQSSIDGITSSIESIDSQIGGLSVPDDSATPEQKASYETQKAALEGRKAELEGQQQELNAQKEQLETQKSETEAQLETANGYLEELNTQMEEQQATVEQLKETRSEQETAYLDSVNAFNEASTTYNEVKNEVMQNVQNEVKEQGDKVVKEREDNDSKVEIASLDTPEAVQTANILSELNKLNSKQLDSQKASAETKALWEKYDKLSPEQKTILRDAFGSDNQLFGTLAALGNTKIDESGETTYAEWLLAPDNLDNLIKGIKDAKGDDGYYDINKLQEYHNSIKEDGSYESLAQSYLILGLAEPYGLSYRLLSNDSEFINDSDKMYNTALIIDNFTPPEEYAYVEPESEKEEQAQTEEEKQTSADISKITDNVGYMTGKQELALGEYVGKGIEEVVQSGTDITIKLADGTKVTYDIFGNKKEDTMTTDESVEV